MPKILNGEEVLEMACQIERDGRAFYERAASFQPEGPARSLLEDLAAMEKDHERFFESLKSRQRDFGNALTGHEDIDRYLDAAVAGSIFPPNPVANLSKATTMRTILETALQREKDTVVFYTAMREAVPHDLGRETLERIIREEVGHVAMLAGAIRDLDK